MLEVFREPGYLAHNKARQDHLASLGLPLENRTVLELGAGAGDHTKFFLDRGCKVTVTDGRPENVEQICKEHPDWSAFIAHCDVESETSMRWLANAFGDQKIDIVYAYGLLYHCRHPLEVIGNIHYFFTPEMLLLETCVNPMPATKTLIRNEDKNDPRCALTGIGSRPTREMIFEKLKILWPFVYLPLTQPNHVEFPLDWTNTSGETRAIFIASTKPLVNPLLTTELPMIQTVC